LIFPVIHRAFGFLTPILLLIALAACDDDQQATSSGEQKTGGMAMSGPSKNITVTDGYGWRMWDAGSEMLAGAGFWISDRNFVFSGAQGRSWNAQKNGGLWQWDIHTGLSQYFPRTRHDRNDWCFSDNKLTIALNHKYLKKENTEYRRLWTGESLTRNWLIGLPGQFEEYNTTVTSSEIGNRQLDRYSEMRCKFIKEPAELKGRHWAPLRESDGYLDFGESLPDRISPNSYGQFKNREWALAQKVRWVKPKKSQDIELPVDAAWVNSGCIKYYEFKGAYFLYDCVAPKGADGGNWQAAYWMTKNCLPAWWLWPNGETEKLCIPNGTWVHRGGSSRVIPMKTGMAIINIGKVKESGLYFVGNDKSRFKAVSGYLIGANDKQKHGIISKDGCRFAFRHKPDALDRQMPRMRIIDFCVGKETKQ
jgi:hypothetical protein